MLRFSAEQVEIFEKTYSTEFDKKLMAFLREEFPLELGSVDENQLDTICAKVVEIAHNCGINAAVPIAQLACLAVATQGNILKSPEILEYLSDTGLPPEERVQLLVEQLATNEQNA